ncbi:MAG: putative spermidine/putrescine transport system substrate-binding protein [Thermomicrobiales bacterium]|jgi:putative spermidine/putrescine transport system substrate-binding protein|nr:putative spermidine/putrescine transport system substrate-binding protein [Thermomicrobiales bacterium]MEA2527981.1 putative spermidine/putrescine transport system substrate-binding protein [Thermomicrobiales bacterium]MEA2582942.1 putative spermidine/putrescine transport system substrate-binding protein [Thermomicrobiales bacterium]MEA2594505.1 putative spermidine/putrescine transport system substrate-binding protein [Thermomicrobiales bacterium]
MTDSPTTNLIAKLRTINISRRGFVGVAAATLAARQGWEARAQESPKVIYTGETFDSGGATLRVASWGGFWEEMERKYLLDQIEKDFNCKVQYDSAWPWFPKYIAGGVKNPPFDVANWNLPELFKTAKAGAADGGFFVPIEEVQANVPNSADLWEFAYGFGHGITYLFSQFGYAYRTDQGDPPADFKSFWEDRYADKRGSFITSNTIQMMFFIVASAVWGKGEDDIDAGVDAMKRAMPMKISDFSGNMQTLIERGEVNICVQHDGEPYSQIDKGVPLGWLNWSERKPILTQTKTVSQGSSEVQKKLAYAYINRASSPEFQEACAKDVYLRPTNKKAVIPENLATKGVTNNAEAMAGLWNPDWDWYLDHEEDIVERVNEIFGQ